MERMAAPRKQALRVVEDLALPSVQVVVIRASMSCDHCHHRVSQAVFKMNSKLLEYVVDIGNKEVVLRGLAVDTRKESRGPKCELNCRDRSKKKSFWLFRFVCFH